MPEPHPAEIRLAALRALLLDFLASKDESLDLDDERIAAMLERGLSLREISLAVEQDIDDVRIATIRLARSGGVSRRCG